MPRVPQPAGRALASPANGPVLLQRRPVVATQHPVDAPEVWGAGVTWRIIEGDCRASLVGLPERSVQTCVTSPPYYSLRDYGHEGQIGLEPTVDQYVSDLCDVFDEVRRVMRDDATLWCNLGDSYGPGKQMLGVPWRVAFALQARGWCLRSDVIWAKLCRIQCRSR
jgi:DNA modification methylase